MRTRILALALIGIMLSSTSFPVTDAATIAFEVNEVNATAEYRIIQPNQYKINLFDGVNARLANNFNDYNDQQYKIKLFDGVAIKFFDVNNEAEQSYRQEMSNSRIISVQLYDDVGTTSVNSDDNDRFVKIISIKQDHDRKALWERIFPLDRIRSSEKQSLYKVIQEDNGLSHLQANEFEPEQPEDNEFLLDTPFGNDIDKFVGKANYAAESITDEIQHLVDVDKFVGKSVYVGNQISVNVQRLTDVDKFVGKSLYVANALVIEIERFSDVE